MLKLRPEQAIILCTGYSDYMNTEKAAQMGIKAFVLKPLTRTILASIVRKVLGEK
jgi:YesN/AraC family two-component response regulator